MQRVMLVEGRSARAAAESAMGGKKQCQVTLLPSGCASGRAQELLSPRPICNSAKMNYGEQLNRERQGQRMM